MEGLLIAVTTLSVAALIYGFMQLVADFFDVSKDVER